MHVALVSPGAFTASQLRLLWLSNSPGSGYVQLQYVCRDKMHADVWAIIPRKVCILIPWRGCNHSGLDVITEKGRTIFHLVAYPRSLLLCQQLFCLLKMCSCSKRNIQPSVS